MKAGGFMAGLAIPANAGKSSWPGHGWVINTGNGRLRQITWMGLNE